MTTDNSQPFVSLILPIRNEAKTIGRCVEAVLAQDYPHSQMEVLVADGMSNDATRSVVHAVADKHSDINVKIIDNPGLIVPTGFNRALREAKGSIIVRIDGHTIIASDYVSECVATLQRTGADNVGGRMNASSTKPFGKAVAVATSTPFGVGGARFHYSEQEEWVDTVYMGAWPREVFNRIGGFDETFACNEDDEFNYRLRSCGGKVLLNPHIMSEYFNRTTPASLWRQYYRYGFYKVPVLQKHPLQMRPRQFAPVILVLTLLVTALLALVAPPTWFLFAGLAALYVVANLAASTITALRSNLGYIRMLPFVFAILHFSYGTGFAMGLIHFYKGWNAKESTELASK